ncbi:alpha/beta-hydrolase, partial [Obelidium mucronatum]
LWYKKYGTGPTKLLFIGGMGDTHPIWHYQYNHFSKISEYTNRGAGFSDAPVGDYSTQVMAEDTLRLLETVGWTNNVHVIGLSMGGMIAQELALLSPAGMIASLTLCSTNAGKCMVPWGAIVGVPRLMFTKTPAKRVKLILEMVYPKAWLESESWEVEGKTNRQVQAEIIEERWTWMPTQTTQGANGQLKASTSHYVSKKRLKEIKDQKIPVMVVTGTWDNFVNPSNSAYLAQVLEAKEYRVFQGAGHAVTIERSKEFNAVL